MLQPLKTILFFDTETTGFCTSGPLETQPYIVQIGWILAEFNGVECFEKDRGDFLFKPKIAIPEKVSEIHGVTDEMVADKPPFGKYVPEFVKLTKEADVLCGHNLKYDLDVLFHEVDRVSEESEKKSAWKAEARKKAVDTMLIATPICKLPNPRGGYKWPKLAELHRHLFEEDFADAHNAMGDITATMRCFVELNSLGHVTLPE